MIRYETLILFHPESGEDVLSKIEQYFQQLSSTHQGKVLSFDVWGKYRLSYPVKKQDYGIYTLVRFELPEDHITQALEEIRTFFQIRCSDNVMRFLNKRLLEEAPLEYQKPDAIVSADRFNGKSDADNQDSDESENFSQAALHNDSSKTPSLEA